MPLIWPRHVLFFSSEDVAQPAQNLLKSETNGKWRCATAGEKQASIILELEMATQIHSIDIGNNGSALVEVLVGRSSWSSDEQYQVLLVASSFMSPAESKSFTNINKFRTFGPDKLSKPVAAQKWDRIKIVCTQPFNKNEQYGLSFINLHSPPEDSGDGAGDAKKTTASSPSVSKPGPPGISDICDLHEVKGDQGEQGERGEPGDQREVNTQGACGIPGRAGIDGTKVQLKNGVTATQYNGQSVNFLRLVFLVVNVGTQALRYIFKNRYPKGELHNFLTKEKPKLEQLRKESVLTAPQWAKLFPAIHSEVSASCFDITLLVVLLREICGLHPPKRGWCTWPCKSDTSLPADIVRINLYRQKINGHPADAFIEDDKFEKYWLEISNALIRLFDGQYREEIGHLKEKTIDPKMAEFYNKELAKADRPEASKYREFKENGNDTAFHYAKLLRANEDIPTLDLSGMCITDAGAIELGKALEDNHTLIYLNLSDNLIANTGASRIANSLKFNRSLKKLNMSNNLISDSVKNRFLEVQIHHNKTLKCFNR